MAHRSVSLAALSSENHPPPEDAAEKGLQRLPDGENTTPAPAQRGPGVSVCGAAAALAAPSLNPVFPQAKRGHCPWCLGRLDAFRCCEAWGHFFCVSCLEQIAQLDGALVGTREREMAGRCRTVVESMRRFPGISDPEAAAYRAVYGPEGGRP